MLFWKTKSYIMGTRAWNDCFSYVDTPALFLQFIFLVKETLYTPTSFLPCICTNSTDRSDLSRGIVREGTKTDIVVLDISKPSQYHFLRPALLSPHVRGLSSASFHPLASALHHTFYFRAWVPVRQTLLRHNEFLFYVQQAVRAARELRKKSAV